MTVAHALAEAVDAVGEVPEPVLDAARLHVVDALGVALAAASCGPVRGLPRAAAELGGDGLATIVGQQRGTAPAVAALVNGALTHSLEFDDTHVGSISHGSSVLAPAALATAEGVGAGGREMLRAYTLGWEVMIRLGLASPGELQAEGFQVTSTLGPFAAAVAAAVLHGDPMDILVNALGIAGSQSAGNFAFLASAATVKAFQPGWAAHSGLVAEAAARAGVSGPAAVFDGDFGFYRLYARNNDAASKLAVLLGNFGHCWYLPEVAFKLYPCCHYIHPFLEALEMLLANGVAAEDVAAIHCRVPEQELAVIAEPWSSRQRPSSAHQARWSLPYVLGLRLFHGRVGLEHFEGEPEAPVVALARACSYEPWRDCGFPARFPAELTVTLNDGSTHAAVVADVRGGSTRPLEAHQVVYKFLANARTAGVSESAADRLLDEVLRAADPDVAAIASVLRGWERRHR